MAKFAEDDRIEQMNAQRRRLKQMEHQRAVEALLDERRRRMNVEKVCTFIEYGISLPVYFFLATCNR